MTTVATTRLEAVNIMLSVIAEAPVNSLTPNASPTVAQAQLILDETDKEVQTEGWHFNSEADVELAPDVNGDITVPASIIRIDVESRNAPTLDITVRDGKLYDKVAHSFTFSTSVKCDVVYLMTFENLPEVARNYILIRAARKLQDRQLGTEAQHTYTIRDEAQARARLQDFESETADHTIFDNPATARVIRRPYPRLP